jgi:hypothetical protein
LGSASLAIERNVDDDIAAELKERYATARTIAGDWADVHDDGIHDRERRERHGRHECKDSCH